MGKRTGKGRGEKTKEWSEVQKLREENQKLKRQVSKLQKVVKNLDLEHYSFIQDLLNSKTFEDKPVKVTKEELEKRWHCFECGEGVMRLIVVHRMGEPYYFRRCDCCSNRTKLKKHTGEVEGV